MMLREGKVKRGVACWRPPLLPVAKVVKCDGRLA